MSDTTKKEVDLNYLLEYSKKENILNEKLLYLDEGAVTVGQEEEVSTVNSYTMTEEANSALKGVFYDSSKTQYWIEILKYIFLGNQTSIIYPLHFRKNVKFVRRIFYSFFFVSMSIFLLWGAVIFLMIGNEKTIVARTVTPTAEMIILTPDYVDIEYNFTVTPTPIPIPVIPPPKKHVIRLAPRAVPPIRISPPRR